MCIVGILPKSHLYLFGQALCLILLKKDKDLIRRIGEYKLISLFRKCLPDSIGGFYGRLSDLFIKAVGEQSVELAYGNSAPCQ